jgi:hypothetical protein
LEAGLAWKFITCAFLYHGYSLNLRFLLVNGKIIACLPPPFHAL